MMENEKKQVLETVSKYVDITLTPFGKPQRTVIDTEKRDRCMMVMALCTCCLYLRKENW